MKTRRILLGILILFSAFYQTLQAQSDKPTLHYTLSMPQPASHRFHMELQVKGLTQDTLFLKMPNWMPGYYQLMHYADDVENVSARDENGETIPINKINSNTWCITGKKDKLFILSYDVSTKRQFVANSFLDSTHAYIVPANNFLYIDGMLNSSVSIKIDKQIHPQWNIVTGLEIVPGEPDEFTAPDFDILYDSPFLIGNLEELPSFTVKGIEHCFIGYKIGDFDHELFISNLKKVVEAAVEIFDDIPYKKYTFIAIGPGRGGIEHLNNTTISFDGNGIKTKEDINRMMNFIGHEYFHHYNVKRIRPFELGPFDYDKGNRTTQLWVSEGLTVYYEYMIVKRAGLTDEQAFLADFEGNINAVENNPGRFLQSLSQSSYYTWDDGPFGKKGETISYYDKGPVVGLFLDLAIRNATQNKKSLDDVMSLMYWQYYKKLQRGFTDAEFQEACESIAGISLKNEFEYIYTTKELDYNKYLNYGGLEITKVNTIENQRNSVKFKINRLENPTPLQSVILKSWLSE
ncbi:MAG: M61 family peptidase [Bacteroidetes bacterium]|nr:M61 family peptidase [Bacteroidota bacterium]